MKSINGEGLAPEKFEAIAAARMPVVLKRFAAHWPSVRAALSGTEALVRYLSERATAAAHEVLIAPPAAKGRFFYRDDLEGVNFNTQTVALPLFLDHLVRLRDTADAPALYMQSTPASQIVPPFALENPNPVLSRDVTPRLWLGNATRVATHFDVADNIAVVVSGYRRFTLFPPDQVKNLYIGPLDFTLAGQPVSLVDPDAPDYRHFPRFHEAMKVAQTVELVPGDAIYIPSPWWHAVTALSPVNVLANYWWRDYPTDCGTPFNWLVHGLLSVRHLPAPEKEAWRAMIDHYVFEDDGDTTAHIPEPKRSVLGRMTPDLARHLRQWLSKQFGGGQQGWTG